MGTHAMVSFSPKRTTGPLSVGFCTIGFFTTSISWYLGFPPGSAIGMGFTVIGLILTYVASRCEARNRRVRAVADKLLHGGAVPKNWSSINPLGILVVPQDWSMEQIRDFQK